MGRAPSPSLTIRPATEADLPIIFSLIHELAEYERASPGDVSITESQLREALFAPSRLVEVLLAFLDGEIAGYAMFLHNFSSWRGRRGVYLEDLFVRPPTRRSGVGRSLLREVARIAVERNCARIEWRVLTWNQPAIDFYRSLGAAPLDEWTTFRITGTALERLADSK